ncbi:MAG TPA: hypothetical protein PLI90_06595 [Rhodocyclaceae bacterium]|nr:hypothetical protein [Rhodocyclaceae bacterium]
MQKLHRLLLIAALVAIYLFGSYASLKAGLTWDELPEYFTFLANVTAVHGLLHGDITAYKELLNFGDRYYGIGFHVPAHFIQQLIEKPVAGYFDITRDTAYFLSKHWVVFNLFFCSGILVRNLMRQFTSDEIFSSLAVICFLLWPYVFGHAMINVKDIPFMFAWLLCTNYSFSMARRYCDGQTIGRLSILLLAIFTGWLFSIRIAGILVLFQYMIMAFYLRGARRSSESLQVAFPAAHIPLFAICLAFFVYVAYPVFWMNPFEVFNAIAYMSHHPSGELNVCTRTFDICMHGKSPITYIPLWLSVKLPVAIIAGYLILPMALMRMTGRNNGIDSRLFKTALLTSLSIPLLLIVRHVSLYNEIRQLLFLMPLFYCVGMVSLYIVSRKIAIAALLVSISIFIADQYLAFPYQYIWFNEVARQFKVEKYFEIDYWGASGRGLANQLTVAVKRVGPVNCLYADPYLLTLPFLGKEFTGCYRWLYDLPPDSPRPYLTASFSKTTRIVNCPEILREKFRLFLGNGDITVGSIRYCQ